MSDRRPTFRMMVGLPYSGKTTYIKDAIALGFDGVHISSDTLLEHWASATQISYQEAFELWYQVAQDIMYGQFKQALANNQDIWLDRTNLTIASRKKNLALIPDHYRVEAHVLEAPPAPELMERIKKREEKQVPLYVINRMMRQYQQPSFNLEPKFGTIILRRFELT